MALGLGGARRRPLVVASCGAGLLAGAALRCRAEAVITGLPQGSTQAQQLGHVGLVARGTWGRTLCPSLAGGFLTTGPPERSAGLAFFEDLR